MDFETRNDLESIMELLEMTESEMAEELGVTRLTIINWLKGSVRISGANFEHIYEYAYKSGIRLNCIKEQLFRESRSDKENDLILFHGAKGEIDGDIALDKSNATNDFGKGFYCGENLEQAAMFVASYSESSLYYISFNKSDLKSKVFHVERDWMLLIAYFRGRLDGFDSNGIISGLLDDIKDVDYIVAPIADNRMFEIIDSFIDGEITDVQCQHCLAATNLGNQYVFRSEKAVKNIQILERSYLAKPEKKHYLESRLENHGINRDKVKLARKQYRNQGQYIEDILK